jgi:tetratricopeptide (TPR) repeat protein
MTSTADRVRAWAERLSIPTYGIGQPDKNPMFLEKRVYQGSSGVVYPYPVIDCVSDEQTDQPYTALFLENCYLKIMILPELGGRVQMALDKTSGYHFIYYNRVIKPALVGLAGPWVSGGIEFNWPQHHRPSTFEPLDWRIVEHADGSATVWCSEIERMFFTKGMHGFTLYPDRASLEISVQLYNRTSEPQTFLWWANPAVHVNDDYQSVFPPDVHAVMDHGKRAVSDFPIATGTYYKVDYAPGTDISRYRNIPVPTSYMAYHSDFDFVGDYDHGRQAGMLHVANHHLVPGKKQWTWGNSDFGRAWDRQLTDADGPYIELMCGAFTDNQPDFSWLMPGEEKRFTQIFMPYKQIGPASNASKDAVLNLEFVGGAARVSVYVTRPRETRVELRRDGDVLWETTAPLSPEHVLIEPVALPEHTQPQQLTVRVVDARSGHELLAFTPPPDERAPIPAPATAARTPHEIGSNEELFLNGLHLEQYRHATYAPEPYYEEALRRDPLDSRCNNALGLLLYRRGKFAAAEPFFRTAIESLTRRNPNPYDGEPYYNLGLALKMQGRHQEAFDAFYKAAWNAAWQDSAYFELARLAARAGDMAQALELAGNALRRNWSHHQARHLKIALLRRLDRADEALKEATLALELDAMDIGVLWEQKLLNSPKESVQDSTPLNPRNATDIALDYLHAGLFEDATAVLMLTRGRDPLMHYFMAYCLLQWGQPDAALQLFKQAAALPPDYCFPHRLESVLVLEAAMHANPADTRAPYYLGNSWYAHRRYGEAITCWEQARELDPAFATVHRNLGLAYFNKLHDPQRAQAAYERAFALNPDDARVLFELDQLAKKLNRSPRERLARLEQHRDLAERRDDLTIEYIALLNMHGRYDAAYAALMGRRFHPWEGGEGKTTEQYTICLVESARALIAAGDYAEAVDRLERALTYPHNLGEGKLPSAQANNIHYYLGLAHERQGDAAAARACFERASTGQSEPTSAVYYNDQPPDMIFYQGLARRKLGQPEEARQIFQKLVDYGQMHLEQDVPMDYFAVSLPTFLVFDEDLNQRNRIHCHYIIGLGYLGLGDAAEAQRHFDRVLVLDANHQGALVHREFAANTKIEHEE